MICDHLERFLQDYVEFSVFEEKFRYNDLNDDFFAFKVIGIF